MSRKFKIYRDYYDSGYNIYKKSTITLNPGVTVLVGCNGIGKTTLFHQLRDNLKEENIPSIMFNNLIDGGGNARQNALAMNDFSFLATSVMSSEGENIVLNLNEFARKIGNFVRKNEKAPEIWILFDAIDSGLSIDAVIDIKEYLFKTIFDNAHNSEVYIIVSANGYEFARGEQCFDVLNGRYRKFSSYESYRKFILKTREEKDKIHDNNE